MKFLPTLLFTLLFYTPVAYSENANALASQASQEYDLDNFKEATKLFEQATTLEPNNYKFNIGLGSSKYKLNDFSSAEAEFRKALSAIQSQPQPPTQQYADALYNLANSLVQQNKLEEAIKNYEESLKTIPDQEHVKNNLEYAKKLLEEQKKQEQQNGQSSDQDSEKQDGQKDKQDDEQKNKEQNNQQQDDKQNSETNPNSPQDNNENSKKDQEQDGQSNDKNNQQNNQQDSQQSNQQDSQDDQQNNKGASDKDNQPNNRQNDTDQPDNPNEFDPNNINQSEHDANDHDQSAIAGETLLNALTEHRGAQRNFRHAEALKQIKSSGGKLPQRDW